MIERASAWASLMIRSASRAAPSLRSPGRPLGRDERRPQEPLGLLVADEIGLELLDLVGEVGAVAPHVLEAVGDVLEQPVGLGS